MILNFGKIFHKFSKDHQMRGAVHIPTDISLWPASWKTIRYKTYDRFLKIKLPEPFLEKDLAKTILNRRSVYKYNNTPITLSQISNLLYFSCGITKKESDINLSRRAQASGGARYPIEVYLVNFKKGELENRVYHYNVREHSLDVLWEFNSLNKSALFSFNPWVKEAGMGIFLTGVESRTVMKYGERGYRYMYYEAGGVANTMNILAGTQELGASILGGTKDEEVEQLLDIDGEKETLLISLMLGNLKRQ